MLLRMASNLKAMLTVGPTNLPTPMKLVQL
jgi:hypothetical protein